jgi:hypothetical protein
LFKKSPEEMYLEAAPQKDDFTWWRLFWDITPCRMENSYWSY